MSGYAELDASELPIAPQRVDLSAGLRYDDDENDAGTCATVGCRNSCVLWSGAAIVLHRGNGLVNPASPLLANTLY